MEKGSAGRFVVDRHLQIGSVLVSCEDNSVYIVSGIYSSWREMLEGYPVPQIVEATLIPYDGKIICDGIVQPYGICLGKNMADEVQRLYRTAKESGNLIKML